MYIYMYIYIYVYIYITTFSQAPWTCWMQVLVEWIALLGGTVVTRVNGPDVEMLAVFRDRRR